MPGPILVCWLFGVEQNALSANIDPTTSPPNPWAFRPLGFPEFPATPRASLGPCDFRFPLLDFIRAAC